MDKLKVGQRVMVKGYPAIVIRTLKYMLPIPEGYVPLRNEGSTNGGFLAHRLDIDAA